MDDMELDQTPAQQPDDPFKDDAAVTAEQTEQPVQSEQPVQTETAVQTEAVAVETQPQPLPAAEAVAEEKPKWVKIVEIVSIICIAAAGLLSALFMCLLSFQEVDILGGSKSLMLKDVANAINKNGEYISKYLQAAGNNASFAPISGAVSSILFYAYILMAMVMGIITGIICGIMLIVKTIQQFAVKKKTTLEKTAITSCLFFFADAAILLNVAMHYMKSGSDVLPVNFDTVAANQYGAATLAGLIICGILFAAYFIGKIAVNYKEYLGDKTKLINGCMNLAWAVIAMLALALLTCAPVIVAKGSDSVGCGFNYVFARAFGVVLAASENANADISSESAQYLYAALGMVIQIWFIFQSGKSLHGAMRGTVSADKAVKLGSQIWRLVFSVLYLIICAALSNEFFGKNASVSLAAPVVILVFAVIGLVLAIVNKVLVKEKSNKQEI